MNLKRDVDALFEKAVDDFGMLDGVNKLVVALSGGSDSVVLLRKLFEISESNGIIIIAAHVNHMIRGKEADSDEEFCRDLCRQLGIVIEVLRADVPLLAKERKKGIEETARDVRYTFFRSVKDKYGADKIAVAHNSDDLAETLIFNIARGAGLKGLSAIKPSRDDIIRPLIYCAKTDIVDYCKIHSYQFVIDSSNADDAYTRNRIRHDIIPVLKEINPSFVNSAIRLALSASEDSDYLFRESAKYGFSSGRKALAKLDYPLLSRVVLRELTDAGGAPENVHVRKICDLIKSGRIRFSVSVPGADFHADRDELYIGNPLIDPIKPVILSIGNNLIGNVELKVSFSEPKEKERNFVKIDRALFDKGLTVRQRLPGDRYRLHGQT